MTLDATRPLSTDFISALAGLGQEERAAINQMESSLGVLGSVAVYTLLDIPLAVTDLITGTHVADVPLEVIRISATGGPVTIQDITLGANGQRKVIYFADANVTFADNGVTIDLNQLPIAGTFTGAVGDFLTLTRIDGIWWEEYRNLRL